MKNIHYFFILLAAATLFGHYAIRNHYETKRLEQIVQLSDKARQIEAETIRDLMHANRRLGEQHEAEKNAAYVSGVVSTIQQPDHASAIWHAGYDRGTEVQILAQTLPDPEKEKPVTKTTLPVTLPKK
jgi:hypothetical protein